MKPLSITPEMMDLYIYIYIYIYISVLFRFEDMLVSFMGQFKR